MNTPRDPEQADPNPASDDEEVVATLLRVAGPRPAVPPDRYERVRQAVHSHWRQTLKAGLTRRRTLWIGGALAAAAAVVLVIGLAVRRETAPLTPNGEIRVERVRGPVQLLGPGRTDRAGLAPGDVLRAGDEVRTASDSRVALRLPGGASLRLDTESRARFVSSSAIALHEGAAYIDTGFLSVKTTGVEVQTPLGLVREVGTQFEVRLQDDSLSLRVRDGSVSLERGGRTYRAERGQQIVAGKGEASVRSDVRRHGEEWGWTLGIAPAFELEGRSLEEFLAWVSSETGWRVEYEERSIAEHAPELILHGSVEGLRPDETPDAVLPTCGLRHRVVEGVLIVERSNRTP